MQIPLSRSDITEKEKKAVLEVLESPYLALGPKLVEFEERLADYTGVKYAVCVNSGTSALHLIIRALGIEENDEVITTPFSFIASANCILFEKAKPVFADIDSLTLNIDPDLVEDKITPKTKAILAVDVFGHPAAWDRLEKIAAKHGLHLIDDSCEAIGSEYKGKKTGSFGNAGAFAFYPNKQMTTGEGGAITTNDEGLYRECRSMRNQGRGENKAWLQHERLGYNYRISDINCALGIAQLERIDEILLKRAKVAENYRRVLGGIEEITLPHVSSDVKMSWFVYVVRMHKGFDMNARQKVLTELRKKGIECSDYFSPIHLQPFYRRMFGYKEGDFPVTEAVSERTVALPFYNNLERGQIEYVAENLKQALCEINRKN
ncbi:MAG: DegT/DnrJ/EryC1/StrS family aminotransferase [Candidatus Omnitrophota bacterium]